MGMGIGMGMFTSNVISL